MIRLNPFRFLGEKRCSSICPKKSTENSIQMVSAPGIHGCVTKLGSQQTEVVALVPFSREGHRESLPSSLRKVPNNMKLQITS